MPGHKIILAAAYEPDVITALSAVLDSAWASIAPNFGESNEVALKAHRKLARIILALHNEINDPAKLQSVALTILALDYANKD
jgi:hypothetical protein